MKTDTYTPTKIETWPVREHEAVKVWRETTAKQCQEKYEEDGAFCAIGVLGWKECAWAEIYGISESLEKHQCPKCQEQEESGYNMVVHWNDDHRYTFAEIADLAEAYPHLVFTS